MWSQHIDTDFVWHPPCLSRVTILENEDALADSAKIALKLYSIWKQ